jgi:hypothetical protein
MLAVLASGLVTGSALLYWLARPLPSAKVLKYTQLTNDGRAKAGIFRPPRTLTDGTRLYFLEGRTRSFPERFISAFTSLSRELLLLT